MAMPSVPEPTDHDVLPSLGQTRIGLCGPIREHNPPETRIFTVWHDDLHEAVERVPAMGADIFR